MHLKSAIDNYTNNITIPTPPPSPPLSPPRSCVQTMSCAQPQQLLQVTLNHLEVLKKHVPGSAPLIDTVVEVCVHAHMHDVCAAQRASRLTLMRHVRSRQLPLLLCKREGGVWQDRTPRPALADLPGGEGQDRLSKASVENNKICS